MLSSPPVWSILVAEFAHSWTMFLLLIAQGRFFKDIFNLAVYQNPILQALPLLMLTILVPLGGQARSFFMLMFSLHAKSHVRELKSYNFVFCPQAADYLCRKQTLSTTAVRKVSNSVGFCGQAALTLAAGYATDTTVAVLALAAATGFSGVAVSGFRVNNLVTLSFASPTRLFPISLLLLHEQDVAPDFAPVLTGLSGTVGSLAGTVCPVFLNSQLDAYYERFEMGEDPAEGWEAVFLVSSAVSLLGMAFYAAFASGEPQPWALKTVAATIFRTSFTEYVFIVFSLSWQEDTTVSRKNLLRLQSAMETVQGEHCDKADQATEN